MPLLLSLNYNSNSYSAIFGFYPGEGGIYAECAKFIHIGNAFGYFPLIGQIVGVIRFIIGIRLESHLDNFKKCKAMMIFRGTVEALGLGILFLIPDLIITIIRANPRHFDCWV